MVSWSTCRLIVQVHASWQGFIHINATSDSSNKHSQFRRPSIKWRNGTTTPTTPTKAPTTVGSAPVIQTRSWSLQSQCSLKAKLIQSCISMMASGSGLFNSVCSSCMHLFLHHCRIHVHGAAAHLFKLRRADHIRNQRPKREGNLGDRSEKYSKWQLTKYCKQPWSDKSLVLTLRVSGVSM